MEDRDVSERIIYISQCDQCRYRARYAPDDKRCYHSQAAKLNEPALQVDIIIPAWCPLTVAPEFGQPDRDSRAAGARCEENQGQLGEVEQ